MTGRQLVGEIVRSEIFRLKLSQQDFATRAQVSRSVITRLIRGEEVSDMTLRPVEQALGLPRDFLGYVERGDVDLIRSSGAESDMIRWVLTKMGEPPLLAENQ